MSQMSKQEGSHNWVALQHKTMTRWINSKIEEEVTDLRQDLLDGLILVKLINKIVLEIADRDPQTKSYCLHPVYKKPTFKLQKYENVDDFLKFLQVVLKINICNISADNIVEGNLKLILGLIWSIFIFSTNSISSPNDGNSFVTIKQILLDWVNFIVHKKGLENVMNFDRDWSLEINRPDLIFLGILDYYLPFEISIKPYSKKLQNMTKVFEIANTIGIPQLADLEDFTLFVPDEKCIFTYALEWFKAFQLGDKFDTLKDYTKEVDHDLYLESRANKNINLKAKSPKLLVSEKNKVVLDIFIETIINTVRHKRRYEYKALLFCNRTNMMISKIVGNTYYFNDFSIDYLIDSLNDFFEMFSNAYNYMDGSFSGNLNNALEIFATIKIKFKLLIEILEDFEIYRSDLKSTLIYNNFPELENILAVMKDNLNSIGITAAYELPQNLSLSSCLDKLSELTGSNEKKFVKLAKAGVNKLQNSPLRQINDYLKIVEANLKVSEGSETHKSKRLMIVSSLDSIDDLINISHKLDYYARTLEISRSTSGLKSLLDSSIDRQHTSPELNNHLYQNFKDIVANNKTLLLDVELTDFLYSSVSSDFKKAHSAKLLSFIKLIPNFDSSADRCDISFALLYASDESDDNNSLFDGLHKIKSNEEKAYDIGSFIEKLDDGFQI